MGYLDNTVLTVDAVLTRKGRECLAKGDGSFKITQFALADDEIDYTLYNPDHPSGSAYFGQAIENMPLLEAFVDETQVMKYKLTTLPRGTSKLPVLSLGVGNITLNPGASITLTPQTLNYLGANQVYEAGGYVATIADSRLLSAFIGTGAENIQQINYTTGVSLSKTVVGTSISLTATTVNALLSSSTGDLQTTLTVVGVDSGARITVPVSIRKQQ